MCTVDGVDTADVLTMHQRVGEGPGLGIAWLLALAGPIGWIGLAVVALSRSGRGEILTVRLPYSREVAARWQAAMRRRRLGLSAVAVVLALVALAQDNLVLVLGLVAIGAIAWGAVAAISGYLRMQRASVGVQLDASRRWVALRGVYPRFAALARDDVEHRS